MTDSTREEILSALADALAWDKAFGPEVDLLVEDDFERMARVALEVIEELGWVRKASG